MTESTTTKQGALLEDSTFNVITQIEKKADFLYSSVEKYVRDAEKDKKPELVKLWSTIKEDEQKHLKMLREELVKAVKENKLEYGEYKRRCCARLVSIANTSYILLLKLIFQCSIE
jgi:rubrerythrin